MVEGGWQRENSGLLVLSVLLVFPDFECLIGMVLLSMVENLLFFF